MKFLQRDDYSRFINKNEASLNVSNVVFQTGKDKKQNIKSDKILKKHNPLRNSQQQYSTQSTNSYIRDFISVLLKHFEQIKVNINNSLDSMIKVLVDRILNETQIVKKISCEKENNKLLSMKQLDKLNQAVQTLTKELEKIKQIFYKKQEEIYFQHLCPVSKISRYKIQEKSNTGHTFKLQHAASHPPRLFYPQNQHDHKLQSKIKYEYQLLNDEQYKNQPFTICIRQEQKNPQEEKKSYEFQQEQKVLTIDQYRNEKTKSSINILSKKYFNFQYLNVANKHNRKLSINLENNQKTYSHKQNTSNQSSKNSYQLGQQMSQQLQQGLSIEIKSPMQKLQQLYRQDIKRFNLKNHNNKIQTKQNSHSFQNISETFNLRKSFNRTKSQFQSKNHISINIPKINKSLLRNNQIKPQRFRKFSHYECNQSNDKSQVNKSHNFHTNKQNCLKTQNKQKFNNETKSVRVNYSPILTLNQLRSAAIYFKSLNLPEKDKIQQLNKSLRYDSKNLSAAQSLSYLYLKHHYYKECLQLCNSVLDYFNDQNKVIKQKQQYDLIHIICNKSAALNLLGRYSQNVKFIQALNHQNQKALNHQNQDCFKLLKNLADAYCSLGRIQTAIIHYKKCLQIQKQNDQMCYNLAACYFMTHCYLDAMSWVLQAIRINAKQPKYFKLYQHVKAYLSK